jgi:hypothetical protein
MAGRMQQLATSASPEEQQKAKEMVQGIGSIELPDLGEYGKKLILIGIDFVQEKILPKITNMTAQLLIAGLLDAIEAGLKK